MAISPFDIVKALNEKTDLEYDIKDYSPWMINKSLSFIKDTIFFANEMNKSFNLDKDIQRDFYKYGIPRGKRFGKWEKQLKVPELVEKIAEYFCINKNVATQYVSLLSDSELKQLQEKMIRGGK